MVDAVIEGTNACIFAFGSTGAGKTHSMLGPEGGSAASETGRCLLFLSVKATNYKNPDDLI